jgi:hypothetical protein
MPLKARMVEPDSRSQVISRRGVMSARRGRRAGLVMSHCSGRAGSTSSAATEAGRLGPVPCGLTGWTILIAGLGAHHSSGFSWEGDCPQAIHHRKSLARTDLPKIALPVRRPAPVP